MPCLAKHFLFLLSLAAACGMGAARAAVPNDFNGDNKPDIVWSNTANGATYAWYMNGPALISDAFIATIDPSWKVQGVGDFNGDGKPDLVWRNTANGNTYVWYMNGPLFVSDAFVFSLPPEWVIQGVADFNADGKPDFLMRNTSTGVAFAWFFNDNVPIGDQFLFGIDPSWKVEQVGDMNGDGQPDLLFRNSVSGLAFAWYTQFGAGNLSLGNSSPPIFSIDPAWEIVQLEDWNADGNRDLLFRNRDTGLVFVWYMTGTTLGGSDFIIQIDPSWEIVPRRADVVVVHPLAVSLTSNGSGTVSSAPPGIDCGVDCSENYLQGTVVALSAVPSANSTFTGWSGACSGTGACNVTMDAAKSVTASFTLITYTLTVDVIDAQGFGLTHVTSTPGAIDCYEFTGTCSAPFTAGSSVTLRLFPGSNALFDNWTGACAGSGSICNLTINANTSTTGFSKCNGTCL